MSLSLDMIGKFVLITIMIAVATGLIMQFEGDISESVSQMLGGYDKKDGSQIVEISPGPGSNQKIASLIDTCYQRSLENSLEDYVCFIARTRSGSFGLSRSELGSRLSEQVASSTELKSSYNSGSIIIRYSSKRGKVVVE